MASVQDLIDRANRKPAASNRKAFAKKANNQQHHANLAQKAESALAVYHSIPALMDNHTFRAAMRELETALTLSKKRLEQQVTAMPRHIDLGVFPVVGEVGRYHIRSAGKSALMYLVDLDELGSGWCGCPHFEYRIGLSLDCVAECKHIRLARAYRRLQRRLQVVRKRVEIKQ